MHIRVDIKVEECCLLNYTGDLLTVLVNKLLVVRLKVNDTKPWEIVEVIECPQRIVECSITGSIVCIIDTDHSIGNFTE